MHAIPQQAPVATALPGVRHITWAGEADGLHELSVWRQSMAPGAATPPHSHDCDEVVLCLAGQGEVHSEGRVQRFVRLYQDIFRAGRAELRAGEGAFLRRGRGIPRPSARA